MSGAHQNPPRSNLAAFASAGKAQMGAHLASQAAARWSGRGFSERTISAFSAGGIEFPEALLFAELADISAIEGIGAAAMREVAAYRTRFSGERPA
jgi:hypothetical protein